MAAQLVLIMRKECPEVSLICVIPYSGFEQRWSQSWQEQYYAILDEVDEVVFIGQHHNRWIYQKRNEWMCDHAGRVIAVWNDQPSRTGNTVRYAKKERESRWF